MVAGVLNRGNRRLLADDKDQLLARGRVLDLSPNIIKITQPEDSLDIRSHLLGTQGFTELRLHHELNGIRLDAFVAADFDPFKNLSRGSREPAAEQHRHPYGGAYQTHHTAAFPSPAATFAVSTILPSRRIKVRGSRSANR